MMSTPISNLCCLLATLVAVGWLSAGCSKPPPPVTNGLPVPVAEDQFPFCAVTHAGNYVLAANSNGFYRASILLKKWEKINLPPLMPTFGQFVTSQVDTNKVFFLPYSFRKEGGLYVSDDIGSTWILVSDAYSFRAVYQNRDGKLYAITSSRILVSENEGKIWKDITGNAFGDFWGVFSDPSFPKRICVLGNFAAKLYL